MRVIDAHAHFVRAHADLHALFDELDMEVLNVSVAHEAGDWQDKAEVYRDQLERFPRYYAWCTTFDPPGFDDPDYADRTLQRMTRDFAAGATACKLWKNTGMKVKDPIGRGRGQGIALPDEAIERIYRTNAERWYPGLNR